MTIWRWEEFSWCDKFLTTPEKRTKFNAPRNLTTESQKFWGRFFTEIFRNYLSFWRQEWSLLCKCWVCFTDSLTALVTIRNRDSLMTTNGLRSYCWDAATLWDQKRTVVLKNWQISPDQPYRYSLHQLPINHSESLIIWLRIGIASLRDIVSATLCLRCLILIAM